MPEKLELILGHNSSALHQINECLKLCRDIKQIISRNVIIDFSKCRKLMPCLLIILAGEVLRAKKRRVKFNYILPEIPEIAEYFILSGFPNKSIELINRNHTPLIHCFNNTELDNQGQQLINFLNQNIPDRFSYGPQNILAELTDNISEHSFFKHSIIMISYNSKRKYIDMGFYDDGISIPSSLEVADIKFKKDKDAIVKALRWGVSSKPETGRGCGLSSSKDICLDAYSRSKMLVLSRSGLVVSNNRNILMQQNLGKEIFNGTLVYLRLYRPLRKFNIHSYLEGKS